MNNLINDPLTAFSDESFMGHAMTVLASNPEPGSNARIEFVVALERALSKLTHGVVRGVETRHDRGTVTMYLDASTEELAKNLGDNLPEVADFLTKLSAEARGQSRYTLRMNLLTIRDHGHVFTVNADGSVRALRLGGSKGVDVPSTVTALEYAIHDALYIDPETGWAWGWFPCGQSSCWKGDGHDGVCEPSGYDPHSHKEEQA